MRTRRPRHTAVARGARGPGVVVRAAAAAAVATEMRGRTRARALLRPRELVSREFRGSPAAPPTAPRRGRERGTSRRRGAMRRDATRRVQDPGITIPRLPRPATRRDATCRCRVVSAPRTMQIRPRDRGPPQSYVVFRSTHGRFIL